ncbi:hypothetical protein L0Y69_01160 [bacterium]|nr:hypothetical protein [bacterium]
MLESSPQNESQEEREEKVSSENLLREWTKGHNPYTQATLRVIQLLDRLNDPGRYRTDFVLGDLDTALQKAAQLGIDTTIVNGFLEEMKIKCAQTDAEMAVRDLQFRIEGTERGVQTISKYAHEKIEFAKSLGADVSKDEAKLAELDAKIK